MTRPIPIQSTIELIPLYPVINRERSSTLDLIVRIATPAQSIAPNRPPLNLGFVIDRSGSMAGVKIENARAAIVYAIEQLQPSDRFSVTIFDDEVSILIPSTPAIDNNSSISKVNRIQPRNSTALHAGWVQGGIQVSQYLSSEAVNRIILLSDGLANVGETNLDTIASQVRGLVKRGVSTSTMGVGDDYDEDLLEAIARSGDGNYYYISSPADLHKIFQTELQGLMSTFGHTASLGIETQAGVELVDVFNDFDRTENGRYKLPNLIRGNKIDVAIRLQIPASSGDRDLCFFRLAWNDAESGDRRVVRVQLRLPAVSDAEYGEFSPNVEVQNSIAQLSIARAKEEAAQYAARGDLEGTRIVLEQAKACISVMSAPAAAVECEELEDLQADLACGGGEVARKKMLYQRYQSRRSEGRPTPKISQD
jgi:Ca-activated chloride channel homolog